MNALSPLKPIGSSWTEDYKTGIINMKNEKTKKYKSEKLLYPTALDSIVAITNQGDNSKVKMPLVNPDENKLKKSTILYGIEDFSDIMEEFIDIGQQINMETFTYGHLNPIWIILFFLISVWIIYFLAK